MTPPALVSAYLQAPATAPSGWHSYLLIQVGRKWARLVSTENAEAFKVPLAELRRAKAMPFKPARARKRLLAVSKTYGARDSAAVRDALQILKEAANGARA